MNKLRMQVHTQTHNLLRRLAVLLITASLLLTGCYSTPPTDGVGGSISGNIGYCISDYS